MGQVKCPICGDNISGGTFSFPKLPESNHFALFRGEVHVSCLRSHPEHDAIQSELMLACLDAFGNSNELPIVARDGLVLIKHYLEQESFEVYDMEDFASFYIPEWQMGQVKNMKPGEKVDLGVNRLLTLISELDSRLKLYIHYSKSVIDMPYLSLTRLQSILAQVHCQSKE